MAFNRFTNIGSAQARVTIDLSQAQASVEQMRSIAQQINASVRDIAQAKVQGGKPNSLPEFDNFIKAQKQAAIEQRQIQKETAQLAKQAASERVAAEKQITIEAQRQFQIAQSTVAQLRASVAEQANLFRTAAATAPSTVSRGGTEQQLRAARQPIVELNRELARLKTAFLQATTPAARNALIPELQRITTEARNAANSIQPLRQAVSGFISEVQASRSGITGYFNSVRENIEKINEQSLAANLQEISFRLLPLGAAAAALTARGVSTAQNIEEATLAFRAFTGSAEEAERMMGQVRQISERFGQPFVETLGSIQRFAPLIRNAGLELDDVYNIAVRLLTLNPAKGIDESLRVMNEALAGQFRSVSQVFNLPREELQRLIQEKGFIAGFDEVLNGMSRTTELAEQFGQTSRASMIRLQDSIDNFLSSSMEGFLEGMSGGASAAAEFFNRLAEGPPIIQNLVGGVLTLISGLTTALITAGQFALAFTSIRAVIEPLNLSLRGMVGNLGRVAALGSSVAAGVVAGVQIAGRTGVGGVSSPQEATDRLLQIMTAAVTGIAGGLMIIVTVLQNGGELIGAAWNNIVVTIESAAEFVGDIFNHFGAVVTNAIGAIEISIGNALRGIAEFLAQSGLTHGLSQQVGAAGVGLVSSGTQRQLGVAAELGGIQSIWDRMAPRLIDLAQMALFPTDAQMSDLRNQMNNLWLDLYNAAAGIFGGTMIARPGGTSVPEDGMGGSGGIRLTNEQLEEALELTRQIAQAQREFALEQQRTMQDRMIAARRESEDFALSQSRALENFNLQQIRAVEDYNRSRAQSIEDFERQMAESEAQAQEQRQQQQEDFNKQMLRAQQDHIRDMIRMARDVDNAISARNFLEAQDQLQRMRDAEEDFSVEQQRRREDYAEQIADLENNLKTQQDKRREDFARQLARQEENFQLQRQRQLSDFERQRQLEEQDRQRRLQRQAQDYALQDQRRLQDFNRRIQDMIAHNNAMQTIWNNGLTNLRTSTQNFFASLPPIIQSMLGQIGAAIGGSGAQQQYTTPIGPQPAPPGYTPGGGGWTTITGLPPGFTLPPVTGTAAGGGFYTPTQFDVGSWFVPQTMGARVHKGEIITPEPFASAVRRGDATISAGGGMGDTYQITAPIQIINAKDMDEDRLADKVASKINRVIEEKNRQNQGRR